MASNAADILTRLKTELAADKKKTAILSSLVLVFVVVLVMQFMPKPDDAAATATDVLPKKSAKSAKKKAPDAKPLVRPEPEPIAQAPAQKPAQRTSRPITRPQVMTNVELGPTTSREVPAVSVAALPRTLDRNLFNTPDWSPFPLDRPQVVVAAGDSQESALSVVLGQLREAMAERREQRRKEKEAILAELEQLSLQSTMTGTHSLAYISGLLVHPGSRIHGFSVASIGEKSVTLEKRGHTFELKLP